MEKMGDESISEVSEVVEPEKRKHVSMSDAERIGEAGPAGVIGVAGVVALRRFRIAVFGVPDFAPVFFGVV